MFLTERERAETVWACRFCMMCHVADRAAHLLRRETYTPRGRAAILFALDQGLLEWSAEVAEVMYASLADGLLREWCVGHYDAEELLLDARARLFEKGLAPAEVQAFAAGLKARPSPGESPLAILAQAGLRPTPGAELLLFAGCTTRQSQAPSLVSLARLAERAGAAWQVLEVEPCCGWPLYQLGDLAGAKEFSVRVAAALRGSRARTVVCLEADCARMLATRTGRLGGDLGGLKILPAVTLLDQWLTAGRLRVTQPLSRAAAYADPCALARYLDETEPPRRVLAALTGRPVRELASNRKLANCCGAGGFLGLTKPEAAAQAAALRLAEAAETGAGLLATGCTRCQASFATAARPDLATAHLVDLLAQACQV